MSTLLLAALKVAFLVAMWLFILFVVTTIRTDLFGRRVTAEELVAAGEQASSLKQGGFRRKQSKPAAPTKVVITTGAAAGNSAELPALNDEILLGRAASANLDVDDDFASSRHAKIWRDEQGFVVEDLLSTNGTYVNGQKIEQPTRIEIGDVVRIGRSQMQLEA